MIIYFSATGNSKHAAIRIAEGTSDRAVSIEDMDDRAEIRLEDGENFGIVAPTYHWSLPQITMDFLLRMKVQNADGHYIYFVTTYGGSAGGSGNAAAQCLRRRHIRLDARFSVRMPNTWTPEYDVSDGRMNENINRAADREIDEIIQKILQKRTGDFMRDAAGAYGAGVFTSLYGRMQSGTGSFHVTDGCNSCGLCERECPDHIIRMKDGKPDWTKGHCDMCLRCLHRCPQFAIRYGRVTQFHGQYVHPDYDA